MNFKGALKQKEAYSFVEITVSMVILGLVMASFISLFVATMRHTVHADLRMVALELEKRFLDELQHHVREDTWGMTPVGNPPPLLGTGNLLTQNDYRSAGLPTGALGFPAYAAYTPAAWLDEPNPNRITYFPVYEVDTPPGAAGRDLRRVTLRICWLEN